MRIKRKQSVHEVIKVLFHNMPNYEKSFAQR
jgi:hypothetical protein